MEKDESHYSGVFRGKELKYQHFDNLYEQYKQTREQNIRIRQPLVYKHFDNLYQVYKECKKN
jgi:hypothetical protein